MQRLTDVQQEMEQEPVAEVVEQDIKHHGYARAIKHLTADLLPVGTKLYTHPSRQDVRSYRTTEPLAYLCKHTGWFRKAEDADAAFKVDAVPLYEAFSREWVGLTDKEITRIGSLDWDSNYVGIWYDFARAIEAKLKEKNS
jgi:hypothetical protein